MMPSGGTTGSKVFFMLKQVTFLNSTLMSDVSEKPLLYKIENNEFFHKPWSAMKYVQMPETRSLKSDVSPPLHCLVPLQRPFRIFSQVFLLFSS